MSQFGPVMISWLTVPCTMCWAKRGEMCRTTTTRRVAKSPHHARLCRAGVIKESR